MPQDLARESSWNIPAKAPASPQAMEDGLFTKRLQHTFRKISNANRNGYVALGDALKTTGRRGESFLILLPALFIASPLGAIPGVPSLLGIFSACITAQILLEHRPFWIPGFLKRLKIRQRRLRGCLQTLQPAIRQVSKAIDARLDLMLGPSFQKAALLICCLLSLVQLPLEFIPFSRIIPAVLVALFSIGLICRDGAFILAGFAGALLALAGALAGLFFFGAALTV